MDQSEEVRTQLGLMRRLARDFRTTIQSGIDGRQTQASWTHSLTHSSRSRDLYSCNNPAVQPLKEFFREYEKRQKLLNHVMTPMSFLLALLQDLEIAEAEAVEQAEAKIAA